MARKNLLKDLMDGAAPPKEATPPTPPRQSYSKGAIGAVSQSIAQLKSRAIVEVHADMVDDAGFHDRLGEDPEDFERLKDSLSTYGQQVPVLLRFDPNTEGRYQVVYGRRRVAALKALKQPVKAMIREINDRDLVIAQGQENSQRRDLSFIEKANFARQMAEANYERKVICDALNIDKTVISRMLNVAEAVPVGLMQAIGPAPAAGRDRWMKMAEVLTAKPEAADDIARQLDADTSDARFEQAYALATRKPPRPPAPPRKARELKAGGAVLGEARRSGTRTTLTFDARNAGDFGDWLVEHIEEIHRSWEQSRGE